MYLQNTEKLKNLIFFRKYKILESTTFANYIDVTKNYVITKDAK